MAAYFKYILKNNSVNVVGFILSGKNWKHP